MGVARKKICRTVGQFGMFPRGGLRCHRREYLCYLEGNSVRATMLRQTLDRLS